MSVEDATAQDVIDALRFVLMAQKDAHQIKALVEVFLDFAPESESDRGIKLILDLIAEGSLRVELADES